MDDLECIVVNDGGAQEPVLPADPRFRAVVRTSSGGPAAARNTGVGSATGEVLTFLDDDDGWTPERLAIAEEGLGTRASIGLCWSTFQGERPHGRRLDGDVSTTVLDGFTPPLGVTAVQMEVWEPFDVTWPACEDVEWWMRIAQEARVATVPRIGLLVGRHTGDRTGYGTQVRLEQSLRLLNERSEYFEQHPRAAAFRWRRVGVMARQLGDRRLALSAGAKAVRLAPSWSTARSLASTLRR
jgi:glycosyltransferase involved in cell wall biosynthesis